MNVRLIALSLILTAMISWTTACSFGGETPTPEPTVASAAQQQAEVVSAEAFVVPVQEADLSLEVGGRVV